MRFTRVPKFLVLALGLGLSLLTLGCGQESPMTPASPTATFDPAGKPGGGGGGGGGGSTSFEISYMQAQMDREHLMRQLAHRLDECLGTHRHEVGTPRGRDADRRSDVAVSERRLMAARTLA